MTQQFELFEGESLKQAGIEVVGSHNADYLAEFIRVGEHILINNGQVTSEDIVRVIGMPAGHVNAVGAAMRSLAVRLGLKRVGLVKATRTSCHARVIAIWK